MAKTQSKVIRLSSRADLAIEAIKYVVLKKKGIHITKSEILDGMVMFAAKHDDFRVPGLDK